MQDQMTFGACLAVFMQERGLSVAALARRTGMKSATTVSRLVHDQSTAKRCAAFLETLRASFPDMTHEESTLLEGGLQQSLAAASKSDVAHALHRLLFGHDAEPAATPLSDLLIAHTDADQYDIYCLQCADEPILDAFTLLLRRHHPQLHIHHFLVGPLAMSPATFVATARSFLCDPRYTLICHPALTADATWLPGNLFLLRTIRHRTEQLLLLIPKPHGRYASLPLDAATNLYDFFLNASLEASTGLSPVTCTHKLDTPRSGLNYLSQAYQREKGNICSLLRTRPDLSMVPLELMQNQYDDAVNLHHTSVKDYYLELRRLCYLRYTNRMDNPRSSRIVFSLAGLKAFLQDGLLMEHFRSLRPYTPEERRQILLHLLRKAEEHPGMRLHIARDERLFRDVHISGFESGVLLSPILKQFIGKGGSKPYTEAFITDSSFTRQFHDHFSRVVIPQFTYTEEESLAILRELLDCAE